MHWENLFDDLENQLAAQLEAERAALATETERLRVSRLSLGDRIHVLSGSGLAVRFEFDGGEAMTGQVREHGVDWISVETTQRNYLVSIAAITACSAELTTILGSLEPQKTKSRVRDQMTLGFVLRDLARRRMPVHLCARGGEILHGTIDRAGLDHFDLALHEIQNPRRPESVAGYRIIPMAALQWVCPAATGLS